MYRILLRSVGNPDFGQDPSQPMSPTEEIMVATLQQAAEAARTYIVRHNLGGGNFPSPPVFKGNQVVARISYNGRIWLPPEGGWRDNDPDDWKNWREAPGYAQAYDIPSISATRPTLNPTSSTRPAKHDRLEAMLRRPEGATLDQLCRALDWQPQSVMVALSRIIRKQRGLKISSTVVRPVRTYRIVD